MKLQTKNWIKFFNIIIYNVKKIIKIFNFLKINLIIDYKLNIFRCLYVFYNLIFIKIIKLTLFVY